MPHILLTGAGFSRNWGGLLANEAFEYLLGSSRVDSVLRQSLWQVKDQGGGFEDALAQLQGALGTQFSAQTEEGLRNLTSAVSEMFGDMYLGFDSRDFEPQTTDDTMKISTFLSRFDAIFTLNQDTLLEQKFIGGMLGYNSLDRAGHLVSSKHLTSYIPGLETAKERIALGRASELISLREPDPETFRLNADSLPYIKLHGSCDWIVDRGLLLTLGGNKAANIAKYPILRWYHAEFAKALTTPNTKLMIIGYSFNDGHINEAIQRAVKQGGLSVFIIDPLGTDVLDKRNRNPFVPIQEPARELLKTVAPSIIGASRRSFLSTFSDYYVEYDKVMRVFG
jgi:hypothetical protein